MARGSVEYPLGVRARIEPEREREREREREKEEGREKELSDGPRNLCGVQGRLKT
jgi:hypothetical protein